MKHFYKIATVFLLFSFSAQSQEKLKTLIATGDWKRVNTLSLFETKPEPVKEEKEDTKRNKKTKETPTVAKQVEKPELNSEKQPFITPTEAVAEVKPADNTPLTTPKSKNSKKKTVENKPDAIAEAKPKTEPSKSESIVKKKTPEPRPKADNTVIDNTLPFQPAEGVKTDSRPLEGVEIKYFDKQNRFTKRESAYFYRKIKLDESGQPKGMVEDYFAGSDKPKFKGEYSRYNKEDEIHNNKYIGTCEFYEEDGSKTVRIYSNGRINSEVKYNKNNQTISQTRFSSDGKTRKEFMEYVFDENGVQIGDLRGGYSSKLEQETAKQTTYSNTGKPQSSIDFIGGCPTAKATFYTEGNEKYEMFYQDFTCEPNEWKFANGSHFQSTFKKENKSYKVSNTEAKQDGFLYYPVPYDFYTKSFEFEAIFEKGEPRTMSEFGMVWEYQDSQNYTYFKVNLTTQMYDINSVKDGVLNRWMSGINPQKFETDNSRIKVSYRKMGEERLYSVNGQPVKFTTNNNNKAVNFIKTPRIDLSNEYKIWGIGFFFKSQAPNESIILKRFEIKLL